MFTAIFSLYYSFLSSINLEITKIKQNSTLTQDFFHKKNVDNEEFYQENIAIKINFDEAYVLKGIFALNGDFKIQGNFYIADIYDYNRTCQNLDANLKSLEFYNEKVTKTRTTMTLKRQKKYLQEYIYQRKCIYFRERIYV